jgi:hypothetical protein
MKTVKEINDRREALISAIKYTEDNDDWIAFTSELHALNWVLGLAQN